MMLYLLVPELNDSTWLSPVILLPMVDISLNESRVQSYDSIEEFNCLLTVVNLRGSEGVHILIVGLELACLEELNCILS